MCLDYGTRRHMPDDFQLELLPSIPELILVELTKNGHRRFTEPRRVFGKHAGCLGTTLLPYQEVLQPELLDLRVSNIKPGKLTEDDRSIL